MRTRAALVIASMSLALGGQILAQSHVSNCGPADRIITPVELAEDVVLYFDDRGYQELDALPDEVKEPLGDAGQELPYGDGRVPALTNTGTGGGVWVYAESGGEPGLQVGLNQMLLGENSGDLVVLTWQDPCFNSGPGNTNHNLAKQDFMVF